MPGTPDNHKSFEAIIDGQLPHDDWYTFGLDEHYPLLNPVSAVGQLAIEVNVELIDLRTLCVLAYERADAEAYETLDKELDLAEEREAIFAAMYKTMSTVMESTDAPHITDDAFPELVTMITQLERERTDANVNYLPEDKAKLQDWADLIGIYYWIEGDSHFQVERAPADTET